MTRIDPVTAPYPEQLGELLASLMPSGVPPLRLFRVLARNPRVLERIRGGNLLDRGSLPLRLRELVILRTTARCGSEYEWGVHAAFFGERAGVTPEQLEALCEDDPTSAFPEEAERRVLALVDALHEGARVDEPLWSMLRAHFDDAQLVELVVLTGFYHTISFVTNAFEIETEPGAPTFPAPLEGGRRSAGAG